MPGRYCVKRIVLPLQKFTPTDGVVAVNYNFAVRGFSPVSRKYGIHIHQTNYASDAVKPGFGEVQMRGVSDDRGVRGQGVQGQVWGAR